MEILSKIYLRCPSLREVMFLLALTSTGLVGNYLNMELFFGVNFLFGSIATMIAVRMSGILWGTLVGIAIGSYTYILWGHPYAIIIFGLEAFFVGSIICCLKRDNMILIDVSYWLLVGVPLVWVSYYYQLGLPEPAVTLIALKQMANGITNVVLASFFVQFTPLTRWIGLKGFAGAQKKVFMYSAINTLLATFILLPMLGATIMSGQDTLEQIQENLKHVVKDKAEHAGRELGSTLNYYSTVLASTAAVELNKYDRASWESTVKDLEENIIPGLLNTEIISADGEILFSYPEKRSGFSLYANEISSVTTNSHYLSNVHVDDGLKSSHFAMILPISGGRFLASSFSPKIFGERLTLISQGKQHIELIDGQGHIVASSGTKDLSGFVQGINPHHLLPSNAGLPTMVRWRQAYWEDTVVFMIDNIWTIRVAAPMAKSIGFLQDDYSQKLLAMLMISVVALLLVPFVSRTLTSPLKGLTLAADMFTSSTERTDVKWPISNIKEVNSLVDQFQKFVQTINEKQLALNEVRVEQERERKETAAQIIQASKLATLGEMATSVAHELNQPLNVIRMAAGNSRRKVSKGTANPEYLIDKLERIEGQTVRAAAIIDHMRMFGREVEESPEPVDPRNVVTNALDLIGEQLRLTGIEIVTELPEYCSLVFGHTIQIEQVILSLLTNARDAMAENDGEAKIILQIFEDDKCVHITLEDTGGGIPKDVLPRIFEPFYTTKEMGKGTGLGLSVSYGIIRDMNGTIVAENIGDGVRFTITLPTVN
jgi:signal transduction histidine kinase